MRMFPGVEGGESPGPRGPGCTLHSHLVSLTALWVAGLSWAVLVLGEGPRSDQLEPESSEASGGLGSQWLAGDTGLVGSSPVANTWPLRVARSSRQHRGWVLRANVHQTGSGIRQCLQAWIRKLTVSRLLCSKGQTVTGPR